MELNENDIVYFDPAELARFQREIDVSAVEIIDDLIAWVWKHSER